MTGTDYSEFRRDDDSDDLVQRLNNLVQDALEASKPKAVPATGVHLPFIRPDDVDAALRHAVKESTGAFHIDDFEIFLEKAALGYLRQQSAVRCFRQSETTRLKKRSALIDDLDTFHKMMKLGDSVDLSVLEHVANPDRRITVAAATRWANPWLHGNFNGWNQFKLEWIGVNGVRDATVLDLYEAVRANEIEVDRLTQQYKPAELPTAVDPAA
jgi:hypothetical protein